MPEEVAEDSGKCDDAGFSLNAVGISWSADAFERDKKLLPFVLIRHCGEIQKEDLVNALGHL